MIHALNHLLSHSPTHSVAQSRHGRQESQWKHWDEWIALKICGNYMLWLLDMFKILYINLYSSHQPLTHTRFRLLWIRWYKQQVCFLMIRIYLYFFHNFFFLFFFDYNLFYMFLFWFYFENKVTLLWARSWTYILIHTLRSLRCYCYSYFRFWWDLARNVRILSCLMTWNGVFRDEPVARWGRYASVITLLFYNGF